MQSFFARRTNWNLATNRYTQALEAHRGTGKELLDLTASNPTTVGVRYDEEALLRALANREALRYEPEAKGLLVRARGDRSLLSPSAEPQLSPDDLILTTSTSEAYSFVFRLLCDPGDAVLVPTPSYPLFDFLADIQDVKLFPYELVYDHGWQIEVAFAVQRAVETGASGERAPSRGSRRPSQQSDRLVRETARAATAERRLRRERHGDHRRRGLPRLLALVRSGRSPSRRMKMP